MRVADLGSGLGQLTHAFAKLSESWQQTAPHWNDDARRHFEENHLQQIPPRLKLLLTAANQLQAAIAAAEQELGDVRT
jgi:hypothetical protein